MENPAWMAGPPARLLLATDLSARCDRAFDRAVQLGGEWGAEVVVLKVLETPQTPDRVLAWASGGDEEDCLVAAQRQLHRDLSGLDVRADMRLARGDAAEAIRKAAVDTGSGLIVTGMARNETLGRFLLGSTVERLARTVFQPLLVVRSRVRGAYRRVLVATDFSDSSRHALHAAARFFPDRELILYHAYKLPLSELSSKIQYGGVAREIEENECAAFLAAADLPAGARDRLRVVIEHGVLETTLTQYVREHQVDLAVMGTHGRSGLMNVLIGNTAARLLDWLPCDTMIVREPQAAV